MKTTHAVAISTVIGCLLLAALHSSTAQEAGAFQSYEYATVSYHGREKTQVVHPDGRVENLSGLLQGATRPSGMEERALFLNIAINAMAKQGYEVVTMWAEQAVMKRRVKP